MRGEEPSRAGSPEGITVLKERIIILDDEASILDVLSEHLGNEGYDCVITLSPLEALDLVEESGASVLLTDLRMPEMSGIDVVQHAKSVNSDLAIVVITALVDVKSAIRALRVGADDYVLKPFNLGEISLAVSRAIEKRNLVLQNRKHQEELERRVHEATSGLERANAELRETKEYLENLLHSTVDAIFTMNTSDALTFANEGAMRMLGYSGEELIGMPCASLYAGGPEEAGYVQRLLLENAPLQNYETELLRKDATRVPVNMSLSFVNGADGTIASTLAICKDITCQKKLQTELKEMSIKDSVTGLFNQRHFYDRLAVEIERARRQNHPLSLLLFDIDQFKQYNDRHGHLAGDGVLQTVGQVVMESTREHVDLGFRYGGDEFTVILAEADEAQAYNIADRIRTGFVAHKFDMLTVSIGLMTYREGYSLRTFIQFTDAMMYDAKRSGGNRIFVYRPESATPGEQE